MIRTVDIDGECYAVRLPTTAREVLEYRCFVEAVGFADGPDVPPPAEFLSLARQWLSRYLVSDDAVDLIMSMQALEVAMLCNAVCDAALPPAWVILDVRRRLMAQEDVSEDDVDMFESAWDGALRPASEAATVAFAVAGDSKMDIELPPWAWTFARIGNEVRGMAAGRDRRRRERLAETLKICERHGLPELPH